MEWYAVVAGFLAGRVSEEELLRAADEDEAQEFGQRCEAYFYAACVRLVGGDRATARAYFRKCVDEGATNFTEHRSARAELERMGE